MPRDVPVMGGDADARPSLHAEPFVRVALDGDRVTVSGVAAFGDSNAAEREPWWRVTGDSLAAGAGGIGGPLLYLHERADGITLSPSIAAIARVDRLRIDRVSWTTFQYLGYYLGEYTPFAGVSALQAGTRLCFGPRGLQRSDARPVYEREPLSRDAALDRFATLFARAVERSVESVPAGMHTRVELSAGLDSRHLLAQLRCAGVMPAECVSSHKYPPDDLDESPIARDVAAFAGVPWRRVPPPENRAPAELDATIRQGLCSDGGAWWLFRTCTRPAHQTGGTAWFNGVGGDVLAGRLPGPHWMRMPGDTIPARDQVDAMLARGAFADVARFLLTRSRRARLLLPLLRQRQDIPLSPFDAVVEQVACDLATHRHSGDPMAAFLLWNGLRRKSAPAAACLVDEGDVVRMPFLDDDVVRFLLSLGPRRQYAEFQVAAMARYGWPPFAMLGEGGDSNAHWRPRPAYEVFLHMTRLRQGLAALPGMRSGAFAIAMRDLIGAGSPRYVNALLMNLLLWELLSQHVSEAT